MHTSRRVRSALLVVARLIRPVAGLALALGLHAPAPAADEPADPYLWLEEVQSEGALAWVRERNVQSRQQLESWSGFDATRTQLRSVLDSTDRIPGVTRLGPWFYNFWRDAAHPRGVWRRTTLESYRLPSPAWETVIDLDALAKTEHTNWVWSGAECLGPAYQHCLISLSRGGADATVTREYDVLRRAFVDGGFSVPEAKSSVEWVDRDTILVGSDFGPGSLTSSGYPRVIKRWRRGTSLAQAVTVFEGRVADVAVGMSVDHTPGHERTLFMRATDFYRQNWFIQQGDQLAPLDCPADARLRFWYGRVLLALRSNWQQDHQSWRSGSLLVASAADFIAGRAKWQAVFEPSAERSLASYSLTRGSIILSVLDNVTGRVLEVTPQGDGWKTTSVLTPLLGTLRVSPMADSALREDPLAEAYLLGYTDFLTPDKLELAHTGKAERETLKTLPAYFDASGMRAEQRFAASADGTRIPYFVVRPAGARDDGRNPTLLYGYGGFLQAQVPRYLPSVGRAWLSRGGVYVLANIRGGGEFGPDWHQAAILANKQKSYDDLAAVAKDLIRTGVTTPPKLGIMGGSNGGLLVAAVMLQHPEMFGAVVSQVPLLDMRRYHRLLAGASWMAEYGDPDKPEQWAWISRYSPYQNVHTGTKLPPVLFTTSTRDDRVHPGHARKMTSRMLAQGHDVTYYENIEGGHGGAADNAQRADLLALEYAFLWQRLGPAPSRQP